MKIQYINHLGPQHDDDVDRMAQAHQLYADLIAADYELKRLEITFERGAVKPDGDADELGFFPHPDVAGALGYHDIDPRGRPYGKVFPSLIPGGIMLHDKLGKGASAAGCASHELAEMAGDRFANLWAFGRVRDPRSRRSFGAMAYELCDPVQDASFQMPAHDGSAVDCSDYVKPNYFNPETPADESTSHLGTVRGPFTIASGGYAIVARERGQTQVFGKKIGAHHDRILHKAAAPPLWREAIRVLAGSRGVRRTARLHVA